MHKSLQKTPLSVQKGFPYIESLRKDRIQGQVIIKVFKAIKALEYISNTEDLKRSFTQKGPSKVFRRWKAQKT